VFDTTRWSLVLTAGSDGACDALEELCEVYWPPVYAYVRRRGYSEEDAKDLVQEFFARVIEKNVIAHADPSRGKFRTFLLTSVRNFLHNEWERANARKRIGNRQTVSIDLISESALGTSLSPERLYDQRWALTVLERALTRLRAVQTSDPARERFDDLKMYLTANVAAVPYAELASTLDTTEGALKTAVHRLRKQYADAIRDEVRETLPAGESVDAEIQYLMRALSPDRSR